MLQTINPMIKRTRSQIAARKNQTNKPLYQT
jgi:hypothetical protein